MSTYYQEKQFLAQVDEKDNIVGKIEKWEAHKKAILHRGYTAVLMYEDGIILQHRKHPVFDSVYDLSFSSHQLFAGDRLQTDEEAIYDGLKREWGIEQSTVIDFQFLKKIYYKAKDAKSKYYEHEIDYIYVVKLKQIPLANPDFAYGQILVPKKDLESKISGLGSKPAPWVRTFLEEKIL